MSESGGESFYYFHTEKFIEEVKKRPSLYNPKEADYNDKKAKELLWREICEAIVPNWEQLDENTKFTEGQDILKKWKNLRDNFRKELNIQEKVKDGTIRSRSRRKYIYYDQLAFLLPHLQDRKGSGSRFVAETQQQKHELKTEISEGSVHLEMEDDDGSWQDEDRKPLALALLDTSNVGENSTDFFENTSGHASSRTSSRKRKKVDYTTESVAQETAERQNSQESMPRPMQQEVIDEDKFFLMSLLPSFKKMSDSQKLSVKMQYLQVLQETFTSSEF